MRYEFHSYCLDARRHELSRDDAPVPIARKAFAVLLHLIEHRDRMVSKAELLEAFWPVVVSEGVVQSTIRQIRKAVGDDGQRQHVIKTYHGEGFRFIAPVLPAAVGSAAFPARGFSHLDANLTKHSGPGVDNLGLSVGGMAEASAPALTPPDYEAASFEERRLSTVLACRVPKRQEDGNQLQDDIPADPHGTFLGHASRLVELHGGLLLHVSPEGFTALFGAALGVEKGTCRAFNCARSLAISMASYSLERINAAPRFGIDAGHFPVVAQRSMARVRALNVAELKSALDLADTAAPGVVAVSDRACSHLGADLARYRRSDNQFLLRAVPQALLHWVAPADRGFARFVGRSAELAFLGDTLARIPRGRGEFAVLAGEAGIGKSRLLAEFLGRAEQRGFTCMKVQADPRTQNTPLAVIGDLAREIDATLAEQQAPVPGSAVGVLDAPDPVDLALWQDLTGVGGAQANALAALTPHMRRQRTFRIIRERLGRVAQCRPVVVAIEDGHWLDVTSRDGLDYLAQTMEGIAALLVITTRPVPAPPGSTARSVTTLLLPPLERLEGLELLQSRSASDRLAPEDAAALVDRAGGNPFFLEQLLMEVEAGADPRHGLPDTVQDVITVRLGRLSAEARTLLLAGSVIGPRAQAEVMADAAGIEPPVFETALNELLVAGIFIDEPVITPRHLRFRHILLQNVAYTMLAPEDRRHLHRRIAAILERINGAAQPERLAWHHQEAGDHLAAIAHWTSAAHKAQQNAASREAIGFARSGLRLIPPGATDPPSLRRELELQLTLAPALAVAMGYGSEEVGIAYRRARDLSRSVGTSRSEFRMLVGLWNYDWVRGDLAGAYRHAGDLIGLAARDADLKLRLRALACMGEILLHKGDLKGASHHLEDACGLFAENASVRAATRVPAVACHCYAAWAASLSGRSDAALDFDARAGAIADELENPFSMALYLSLRAELLLFEGDVAGCKSAAHEACAISLREGFPFWHGTALVNLGWAEAHDGDPERGLASLQDGIAIFEATGARVQLANWYGLLAEVLVLTGELPAARTAIETATEWAQRTGDVFFLPRIMRTRAVLDAHS
jgi:DNA-binding winged helix-turn-helix (wHTH) protein